jgi:hypothetical protein
MFSTFLFVFLWLLVLVPLAYTLINLAIDEALPLQPYRLLLSLSGVSFVFLFVLGCV